MLKRLSALLILLAASVGFAIPTSSLFDQINPLLTQVSKIQAKDRVGALKILTSAENIVRESGGDLAPLLRTGISRSLADAKISLSRKSSVDVTARIGLIKAIFGKALYDDYFAALAKNNAAEASALLPKVLAASGLSKTLIEQAQPLADQVTSGSTDPNRFAPIRSYFEKTFGYGILANLKRAAADTTPTKAFLDMSRAYALYIVIQDSPRANKMNAQVFVDALSKLSAKNMKGFKQDVANLSAIAQTFLDGATALDPDRSWSMARTKSPAKAGVISASKSKPKATTQTKKVPAKPVVAKVKPKPTPTQKVVKSIPKPAAKSTANKPTKKVVAVLKKPKATAVKKQVAPVVPKIAKTDFFAATGIGLDDPEKRLSADLQTFIKTPEIVKTVSDRLLAAKVYSIDEWKTKLQAVEAGVLEAQSLANAGDFAAAKTRLESAYKLYHTAVSPVPASLAPESDALTERAFQAGLTKNLRSADYAILASQLTDVGLVPSGQTARGSALQVGLLQGFYGLPRSLLFLLAGLVALVPMGLLKKVFWGRNQHWRYLGMGFFLLLAPILLEAISSIGSLLGSSIPPSAQRIFDSLSVRQNGIGQMLWVALVLASIYLANKGLQGIAEQFGLTQTATKPTPKTKKAAGSKSKRAAEPSSEAEEDRPKLKKEVIDPTMTSESVVEWDEEF